MTTPTPSLDATEARAADAKAPRITLEFMKSQVQATWYIDGQTLANSANYTDWNGKLLPPNLHVLTICMIALKNGFILTGKSAPCRPTTTTWRRAARSPTRTRCDRPGRCTPSRSCSVDTRLPGRETA